MPRRRHVLASGEYYHVFNKSIYLKDIFVRKRDCVRALQTLWYYRFRDISIRFSEYKRLPDGRLIQVYNDLVDSPERVAILAYCLMPNHFHLLARQEIDSGISQFLADFQNSYTRYFNESQDAKGPIFLPQFKAKHLQTNEQLIHVSRYIHLNPLTGYLVNDFPTLKKFAWSSLPEYLGNRRTYQVATPTEILSHFSDLSSYISFMADQTDYQRQLKMIEHLVF